MSLRSSASESRDAADPFDLVRFVAAMLLVGGTVVALVLWATGISEKALLLIGSLWSIYGLIHATLDGVLDPLLEFGARVIGNAGLIPYRQGYSAIESLVARGEYQAAAVDYSVRAARGDADALTRRAVLLAGPLHEPQTALQELEQYREAHTLKPVDDIRIGLALAQLHERSLADPGLAMRELRRLIDRYPTVRGVRRMRQTLAALKQQHQSASPL